MTRLSRCVTAVLMAVIALAVPSSRPVAVRAQTADVDPALYAGMQWRSVGPARGGRSIAVGGSESATPRVLVRRHRGRRLEDDRRRHHVGADDRRQDHDVDGRRPRRVPGES